MGLVLHTWVKSTELIGLPGFISDWRTHLKVLHAAVSPLVVMKCCSSIPKKLVSCVCPVEAMGV